MSMEVKNEDFSAASRRRDMCDLSINSAGPRGKLKVGH
jgi:hypothetical protein